MTAKRTSKTAKSTRGFGQHGLGSIVVTLGDRSKQRFEVCRAAHGTESLRKARSCVVRVFGSRRTVGRAGGWFSCALHRGVVFELVGSLRPNLSDPRDPVHFEPLAVLCRRLQAEVASHRSRRNPSASPPVIRPVGRRHGDPGQGCCCTSARVIGRHPAGGGRSPTAPPGQIGAGLAILGP